MQLDIQASPSSQLGKMIVRELRLSSSLRMACAYVSERGLGHIENDIERILSRRGTVSILHGADFRVTHPQSIKRLANLNLEYESMFYRVRPFFPYDNSPLFHPKMYLMGLQGGKFTSVIGSSNVTQRGLFENVEVNVVFRGGKDDLAIKQSLSTFDSLQADEDLVEPWAEWIAKYESIYSELQTTAKSYDGERLDQLLGDLYLLSPQNQPWVPLSQKDCVVKALQELEAEVPEDSPIHLSRIYERTKLVAQRHKFEFDWSTFENSVRGRINVNCGERGERLFERLPYDSAKKGLYRLSTRGRSYSSTTK